ncbi:MAG: hypothetical protein LW731_05500 [Oxalobacteraceae bacterium]|nr:hypothetical protein [Oxalobacteraceae bacterium]
MKSGSKRLLLIWGVLLALAVLIFIGERQRSEQMGLSSQRVVPWLLPAPMQDLGAVEIMVKGSMHRFERDAEGRWFYHGVHDANKAEHGHNTDPQMAAVIDKAMVVFGRVQREQKIALKAGEDEYGVTRPDVFILVYLPKADSPLASYAVGTIATDRVSRYILPVGAADIVTVPDFHIKNLLALIDAVKIAGATKP